MPNIIHEIFMLVNHLYLIDWTIVIPLIVSVFSFGSSWLDYLTASKSAAKLYSPPCHVQSRRIPLRQQTRIRRRKHRSSI